MRFFRGVDWVLVFSAVVLSLLGLATMKTFSVGINPASLAGGDYYFNRQVLWLVLSVLVFILALFIDWEFLKTNSIILLFFYLAALVFLAALLLGGGSVVKGAESWYKIYSVALQPVELMKIILVLVLAKYFSRRHVEIARFFHIFVSGAYTAIPVILVMFQPDFGSAVVMSALWLGMALVGGIKVRHILLLLGAAVVAGIIAWNFVFLPYQKSRILAFLEPARDVRGAGYHALQSTIAVGSGEILGKGIGFGTQSRLSFLPEKESDFIFAAFAEEWGLIGVLIIFLFFGLIIWRILRAGIYGESNFEKLYAAGLAILFFSQATIHVGMNMGLLPITGLGMPFMSYGGSSLVSAFLALGILESFAIRKKGIFIGMEERFKEGVF
ncbi:MAG: FtsW/RodA/SpoVE family cell cycle protein [bacterium]|nr:FtsW/RodA/SpoVE family cell cycle protein [bacterium]